MTTFCKTGPVPYKLFSVEQEEHTSVYVFMMIIGAFVLHAHQVNLEVAITIT